MLQVPLLAALNASQRSELCTALKPRIFNAGEMIVRKGEPGEAFYIVESGSCVVLGDSGQASKPPSLLHNHNCSHKQIVWGCVCNDNTSTNSNSDDVGLMHCTTVSVMFVMTFVSSL